LKPARANRHSRESFEGREKRVEARVEELKAIESRITAATNQKVEADAARFKGLITMYEGMKPKDAAKGVRSARNVGAVRNRLPESRRARCPISSV